MKTKICLSNTSQYKNGIHLLRRPLLAQFHSICLKLTPVNARFLLRTDLCSHITIYCNTPIRSSFTRISIEYVRNILYVINLSPFKEPKKSTHPHTSIMIGGKCVAGARKLQIGSIRPNRYWRKFSENYFPDNLLQNRAAYFLLCIYFETEQETDIHVYLGHAHNACHFNHFKWYFWDAHVKLSLDFVPFRFTFEKQQRLVSDLMEMEMKEKKETHRNHLEMGYAMLRDKRLYQYTYCVTFYGL